MPLRMTRLAVSRALVSATTLPPLTTSCGEPTPGLAHGINSSPAHPEMCDRYATEASHPFAAGSGSRDAYAGTTHLPLRQQRRCGYQGQLEARGAGARLQTENVSPAAGYQWAPIQWASLREHRADAARAAPQVGRNAGASQDVRNGGLVRGVLAKRTASGALVQLLLFAGSR